jgi:hypothetical protein
MIREAIEAALPAGMLEKAGRTTNASFGDLTDNVRQAMSDAVLTAKAAGSELAPTVLDGAERTTSSLSGIKQSVRAAVSDAVSTAKAASSELLSPTPLGADPRSALREAVDGLPLNMKETAERTSSALR